MTTIESMYSLSNLNYAGIFDYIEDKVRIYARKVYFLKGI